MTHVNTDNIERWWNLSRQIDSLETRIGWAEDAIRMSRDGRLIEIGLGYGDGKIVRSLSYASEDSVGDSLRVLKAMQAALRATAEELRAERSGLECDGS